MLKKSLIFGMLTSLSLVGCVTSEQLGLLQSVLKSNEAKTIVTSEKSKLPIPNKYQEFGTYKELTTNTKVSAYGAPLIVNKGNLKLPTKFITLDVDVPRSFSAGYVLIDVDISKWANMIEFIISDETGFVWSKNNSFDNVNIEGEWMKGRVRIGMEPLISLNKGINKFFLSAIERPTVNLEKFTVLQYCGNYNPTGPDFAYHVTITLVEVSFEARDGSHFQTVSIQPTNPYTYKEVYPFSTYGGCGGGP